MNPQPRTPHPPPATQPALARIKLNREASKPLEPVAANRHPPSPSTPDPSFTRSRRVGFELWRVRARASRLGDPSVRLASKQRCSLSHTPYPATLARQDSHPRAPSMGLAHISGAGIAFQRRDRNAMRSATALVLLLRRALDWMSWGSVDDLP